MRSSAISLGLLLFTLAFGVLAEMDPEDPENPHRNPTKCEVCKFVAVELEGSMKDTGKTKDVLQIGHRFDKEPKRIKYSQSELRLTEVLEDVCERILEYNIHAERQASRRFAKGRSETMSTLWDLRNKGVKVELGIPENMWDEPSAAVTKMKQYCHQIIEQHESSLENWFFKTDQSRPLIDYFCADRVLVHEDRSCLGETWTGKERIHGTEPEEEDTASEEETKKKKKKRKNKKKGDSGSVHTEL